MESEMQATLDLSADIIDIRDIIARIEELEELIADMSDTDSTGKDAFKTETQELRAIMEELKGQGGDEQWEGNWYPVTLIADVAFEDYAQTLAHDIGALPSDLPDYIVVDWERTARNIQVDYDEVLIEGGTYWFR